MTAPDDRARDEQPPIGPLHEHGHNGARGIVYHKHDEQRWHWHVDDGPPGRTAAEAGVTDDLPKYPQRFPDEQSAPAGDDGETIDLGPVTVGDPLPQPAPAGDDELREAIVRERATANDKIGIALRDFVAECDERGRELERLREELDEWEAMRNEWRDKAFAHCAEVERLRAEANCGEGHDVTRICCAHAKEVKRLRAQVTELEQAQRSDHD